MGVRVVFNLTGPSVGQGGGDLLEPRRLDSEGDGGGPTLPAPPSLPFEADRAHRCRPETL